jgi:ribonuclease D
MAITLHQYDLPSSVEIKGSIAVDTECMGLNPHRDRLCLLQLSTGDGNAHLVQFDQNFEAPNLKRILTDPSILKIFHYARFDIAAIQHFLGVMTNPIYCTKIASRLTRTFADRHGLKDLCKDLLNIEISKQQQSSDWGAETLSEAQKNYAAADVYHLHALKDKLDAVLKREGRTEFAQECFKFLPTRARLDLAGWQDDIFNHS